MMGGEFHEFSVLSYGTDVGLGSDPLSNVMEGKQTRQK